MSARLAVMDIGDVLIQTVPMAQYRALELLTGHPWRQIAETVEGSGIIAAFETGSTSTEEFTAALLRAIGSGNLRAPDLHSAWNKVIGGVDEIVGPVAAELAMAAQLVLASNTNPLHWAVVNQRLSAAGICAPSVLSFGVGRAKPDRGFFEALALWTGRTYEDVLFIDDRADNVEAATMLGLTGWHHRDPEATARLLRDLLS